MSESNSMFDEDLQLIDDSVDIIQKWITIVPNLNGRTEKDSRHRKRIPK